MLDDEELEATRRLIGADTKIIINAKGVDEKIKELEEWQMEKTRPDDEEQWLYLQGKIDVLRALLKGDVSKI